MSQRLRWRARNQQQHLLDYAGLKHHCPEGIYLSLTPGNFSLWPGVLFVRKGPYAPAILRFSISFPPSYPDVPPAIAFASDIFHPLITPLTTYTYTTGASAQQTVSASDEERLEPGAFSLRHGFPNWFRKKGTAAAGTPGDEIGIDGDYEEHLVATLRAKSPSHRRGLSSVSVFMPPPKPDVPQWSAEAVFPSVIEILHYFKKAFEDEGLLDTIPADAAANPSALHAWNAHRRKAKQRPLSTSSSPVRSGLRSRSSTPHRRERLKGPAEWNWDGVWSDRVRKGVVGTLSEGVLYGAGEGDDMIRFLDLEQEEIDSIREDWLREVGGMQ